MNIEYELFKKSTFNYPNLIKYGFIKELNGYKYEKNILNSVKIISLTRCMKRSSEVLCKHALMSKKKRNSKE